MLKAVAEMGGMASGALSRTSAPGMHMAESVMRGFGGSLAQGMAGGAVGGVVGSYYNHGEGGGAIRGAIAGAAVGLGAGAAPRALTALAPHAGSYSSGMIKAAGMMGSRDARMAAFGGGGMLAGFAFGGNRSHKQGFNSNRGNSIGR